MEEETEAQAGCGFPNDTQHGQGVAGLEFARLTPKSVFSQGHTVDTFRRT